MRAIAFIVAFLFIVEAHANGDPFPRLGGVNNGGSHNYDDANYQADLAKLAVVMIGVWPGWNSGRKMTLEQSVRNIKTINPNTRMFLYENSMEIDATSASYAPYFSKVDAEGWWLTASNSSTKLLSEYGAQTKKSIYQVNTTLFAQAWDWHARWIVEQLFAANPSIDGFFEDNVFYQPRVSGDWNRDGVNDSPSAARQWLQEGYKARFALLHSLMPGKQIIGNVADFGTKSADLSTIAGALDGGIIEAIIGQNYSPETWGGWSEMLRWYRKTMAAIAEPRLVMFHMVGSATDYQGARYGLASCLMDDGYFAFTDSAQGYSGVVWFDEYDANLGNAVSVPPTSAWQSGVYRRDFDYGVALVNPKGNGAQDVRLETTFRKLTGKQAPSVNDGSIVTIVHLNDRDGLILRRVVAPRPPVIKELQ